MPEKVAKKKTAKRATRKTTSRQTKSSSTRRASTRKAPTNIALTNTEKQRQQTMLMIAGGCLFAMFIISIVIGFTGGGSIAVDEEVKQRKSEATPEELVKMEEANDKGQTRIPKGGLVPTGDDSAPLPTEPAEAGDDETEDSASSTDSIADTDTEGSAEGSNKEDETAEDAVDETSEEPEGEVIEEIITTI